MDKYNGSAQRGGIFVSGDPETAFDLFRSKCLVELVSTGKSGSVFVLTYNGDSPSPYKSSSVLTWLEPVTQIAIKLMAITNHYRGGEWEIKPGELKDIDTEKEFYREVLYQTDVFLTTASELQQMTPAPVFAKASHQSYYNTQFIDNLILRIDKSVSSRLQDRTREELLGFLSALTTGRIKSLGIIAMELASQKESFYSLYSLRPVVYNLSKDMARMQIINMAIKTGYLHLDFHAGNILIRRIGMKNNDVFVIDFGRCIKIAPEVRRRLGELLEAERYRELLDEFRHFKDRDGDPMSDWLDKQSYDGYEWFWDQYVDERGMHEAIIRLEELYQEKRAVMERIGLSQRSYHASLVRLYEPAQHFVNRDTSPPSKLAFDNVRYMKRTARLYPGTGAPFATQLYPGKAEKWAAAEELSRRTEEVASLLSEMTDMVSDREEKKLQKAMAMVASSQKKLASVIEMARSPGSASALSSASALAATFSTEPMDEIIHFAQAIMSGKKVSTKQAKAILGETTKQPSRVRSVPSPFSRRKSAKAIRQTRRYKSH